MDDLQTLWHKAQPAGDEQALATEQLTHVIRQKSRNEFEKFRRTLFWEILFNAAFTIACGIYVMVSAFREFPLIMSAAFLMIGGFLAWQCGFYLRLHQHSIVTDVRQRLESDLAILRKFVLHYKIAYGVMLPLSGVLGFMLSASAMDAGTDLPIHELPQNPWIGIPLTIAILGLAFLAIHFQFKYLYQPKINRIQALLDALY